MTPQTFLRLSLLLVAVALPVAALTSCGDDKAEAAGTEATVEAKYHYAVAMTGVV